MNSKNINKDLLNSLLNKYKKGERESSILQLEKYIKEYPSDILASYNLGVMYQETNQVEKAIKKFLQVLKKDKNHWQSLTNLGLLYFTKRMYKESNKYHYAVLRIKKDYQPALRDIGTNNLMLLNYEPAENYLTKSLKLNPLDYICLNSLGVVKMRLDKAEEAKKLYEKAITVNNSYYTSYNNLGLYYERIGDKDEAFKMYKKCLEINPSYPNALNNLGLIYFYYEKNNDAFKCFDKALKIDPNMTELYFNLGDAFFKLGNFEDAELWYSRGFKKNPKSIVGHHNYSFMLLALHQYKKAWIEYDYRLIRSQKIKENLFYNDIKNKLWDGYSIEGERVLVMREQGAGDEILYSSMYKEAHKLNPKITFEADPRLISLFTRSFGIKIFSANKISANKKMLKNFDKIICAGSLGRIFRQKKEDFPKKFRYLKPDEKLVMKIKSRLNDINDKPKIGISWFSKNKRIGGGKSINLIELLPFLKFKEVSYVNMQYDDRKKEISNFKKETGFDIIDLEDIDKFNDFESLAALIESLDLFITVSNTTAHLSGSIGKETWIMAPSNDSLLFYWNTGERTTPWYPKIKIYPKINSWNNTIMSIKSDLKKWIEKN